MVQLISNEWGVDKEGNAVKRCVYLANTGDVLPEDAAVGSRAIFENGEKALKTPSGWQKE